LQPPAIAEITVQNLRSKLHSDAADLTGVVPRPRRNIVPNRIYLVSQQGNKRHPVYVDDQDCAVATNLLRVCALRYGVKVLAFGYGDCEGQWLLKPTTRCGLSCLMRDMQSAYSRHLNQKYNHRPCCAHRRKKRGAACHDDNREIRNSSNWTARFKATEIDPEHFQDALDHIGRLQSESSRERTAARSRQLIQLAIDEALHRNTPVRRILAQWERHRLTGFPSEVRAP